EEIQKGRLCTTRRARRSSSDIRKSNVLRQTGNDRLRVLSLSESQFNQLPDVKTNSDWIDIALLRSFEAEGTDAHRPCRTEDGWVERFGREILISYKRPRSEEHTSELQSLA